MPDHASARHLPGLFLSLAAGIGFAGGAGAAELPDIRLQPVGEEWQVEYRLATPATALLFARTDRKGQRAASWSADDPAFELVLEGGEEVLRRRDGKGFSRVSLRMPPRYVPLEKDYAPFSPFGDGGLLIHSGRFHACADSCAGLAADARWSFRIAAPAHAFILHAGQRHAEALTFDDGDSGTNLYVGATEPVETAHVLAVVDATLPAPARDGLNTLFPRLMDLYASRLGRLAQKPMLFASNDEAHPGGGYGHQGGTLPGQIFIHLYGPQRQDDPLRSAATLGRFFAHEAAHLYQHYELAIAGTPDWIHEGGAEALALVALRQLGELDSSAEAERVDAARSACARSLQQGTLDGAGERGDFQAYYDCGLVLQMAADAAARARSDGACDLLCVWRDFLDRVEGGAPWSQDSFLAAVEQRSGSATRRWIDELSSAALTDAEARLRSPPMP